MFRLIAVFLCILVLFTACSTAPVESSAAAHETESSSASSAVEPDTDSIGSSEPESSAAESTTEPEPETSSAPERTTSGVYTLSIVTPNTDMNGRQMIDSHLASDAMYFPYRGQDWTTTMLWCDLYGNVTREETFELYDASCRFPFEPEVYVQLDTSVVYFYEGDDAVRTYTAERDDPADDIALFGNARYLVYTDEGGSIITQVDLDTEEKQSFVLTEHGYSKTNTCWHLTQASEEVVRLALNDSETQEDEVLYLTVPGLELTEPVSSTLRETVQAGTLTLQANQFVENAAWLRSGHNSQVSGAIASSYECILNTDESLMVAATCGIENSKIGVYRQPNGEPLWEVTIAELMEQFDQLIVSTTHGTNDLYPAGISTDGNVVLLTNGEQVYRLEVAL